MTMFKFIIIYGRPHRNICQVMTKIMAFAELNGDWSFQTLTWEGPQEFEETTHTQKYDKTQWRKNQNGKDEGRKLNDSSLWGKPNKRHERNQDRYQCPKKSSISAGKASNCNLYRWGTGLF